jgi:dienelactone hydrolase
MNRAFSRGLVFFRRFIFTAFVAVALSACSTLSDRARVDSLAGSAGFIAQPTANFTRAWLKPAVPTPPANPPQTRTLTVFIEGDGAPWPSPTQPPIDPTPHRPVALQLAVAHAALPNAARQSIAYLARPCQYLDDVTLAQCPSGWWRRERFAPAPLAALDAQLTALKATSGATRLQLIGHSGGGAVAALLAATRSDVSCLVTLAAPLDTDAWTTHQRLSPLTGSRNPLDHAQALRATPQTHFAGQDDRVVPPQTLSRWQAATAPGSLQSGSLQSGSLPSGSLPSGGVQRGSVQRGSVPAGSQHSGSLQIIAGADHDCCWVSQWRTLAERSCLAQAESLK